jgi:hypothetical protein
VGKSYRKNPIFKNSNAESDRFGKTSANRKLRGKVREALKNYDPEIDEDIIIPEVEEVSDSLDWPSDGKSYKPSWERGPDKRDMSK